MTSSRLNVLITGASKGIGLATSKMLADQGHAVVGLARTQPDDFPGVFHAIDLGDEAARGSLFNELAAEHQFDGLLNNVGLVNPAPLEEITLKDFDACADVNLRCSLQAAQAVVPHMKERGSGRILFTSSMVVAGVPFRSSYAAAKAGMVSFTRSWALELAPFGITVNAVCPGLINTEMVQHEVDDERLKRYTDGFPIHRLGEPFEAAELVAFLASDRAAYITGQGFDISGGDLMV